MTIANAERLEKPINLGMLVKPVRSLIEAVSIPRIKPMPWKAIWHSGIPEDIIWNTGARYFLFQGAFNEYITHEDMESTKIVYGKRRKELLDFLHQNPQGRTVYRSLHQTPMFTVGPRETLGEKCQRIVEDINRGKDRFLHRILRRDTYEKTS